MKLAEALEMLEKGKKIRKKSYPENQWLMIAENGTLIDESGVHVDFKLIPDILTKEDLANDVWELFDDRDEIAKEWKDLYNAIMTIDYKYETADYKTYQLVEEFGESMIDYLYELLESMNKIYKLDK